MSIITGGFAAIPSVMRRLGIQPEQFSLTDQELAPVGKARKLRLVMLPLLVLHGEADTLLPVEQGQALYDASPTENKTILRISSAGHNDLMLIGMQRYFNATAAFIR